MKLGIISNNYPPEILGGAEICAQQLSDELSQREELFVFAGRYDLKRRPSSYTLAKSYDPYPIYRIELGSAALDYKNPLNFYNPFIGDIFKRILDKEEPELLHAHNLAGLSLSPIVYSKKNQKIPVVMTLHDFWLICPKNTLLTGAGDLCDLGGTCGCDGCNAYFLSPVSKISMNVRNKIVGNLCSNIDMFISPSKRLMEIMSERGYDFDIQHIENGLDLERYIRIQRRENSTDIVKILMLSYLSYHKGVYTVIDAIERLVKTGYTNVFLVLAGPFEDESKLRGYIAKKRLNAFVTTLGKVSEEEKLRLFADADIFVLPSLWYENQPLTIIEAMASGLPVVGSNLGGIPEMVLDGQTGYLFERGNSQELSEKLEELVLNPRKRWNFGALGRERAMDRYDIRKNAGKVLKVFEGLL